eukprot:TRINITY_DN3109_c0_g1_i1.p1 TRINITY_DN3109_c0_g1~~TRINITY_DN3109_c0_g1_i1.p1  ORF type:complete len:208 (+),score=-7.81 TRINITY_DN3109_c0_g1_i1:192-815(+)
MLPIPEINQILLITVAPTINKTTIKQPQYLLTLHIQTKYKVKNQQKENLVSLLFKKLPLVFIITYILSYKHTQSNHQHQNHTTLVSDKMKTNYQNRKLHQQTQNIPNISNKLDIKTSSRNQKAKLDFETFKIYRLIFSNQFGDVSEHNKLFSKWFHTLTNTGDIFSQKQCTNFLKLQNISCVTSNYTIQNFSTVKKIIFNVWRQNSL